MSQITFWNQNRKHVVSLNVSGNVIDSIIRSEWGFESRILLFKWTQRYPVFKWVTEWTHRDWVPENTTSVLHLFLTSVGFRIDQPPRWRFYSVSVLTTVLRKGILGETCLTIDWSEFHSLDSLSFHGRHCIRVSV